MCNLFNFHQTLDDLGSREKSAGYTRLVFAFWSLCYVDLHESKYKYILVVERLVPLGDWEIVFP